MSVSGIVFFVFLAGTIGVLVGGPVGFCSGIALALAIGIALRRQEKLADSREQPPLEQRPLPQEGLSVEVTYRPSVPPQRRRGELRWIPANESIEVAGYTIPSGLIYVCKGEPYPDEASAIDTRLPVGHPAVGAEAALGYYSQYRFISPNQRAAYLAWLAAGRKDEDPTTRDLGYVFLFIYGLERRLLIDKSQEQEPVAELVKLLQRYGRSRSLQSYVCQLIHFWGWNQGPEYYARLREWMGTLPVSLLMEDEMAIVLASLFQERKPLPPILAYDIAFRHPDASRSVVVKRVNTEFRELFTKRYLEQCPGGLLLRCAKNERRIEYRPASPTLLQHMHGSGNEFTIKIPDVLGITSQFKPLVSIWNDCIQDLLDYSKAKSKEGASAELKAHLALPDELRSQTSHPLAIQWSELLSKAQQGQNCTFMSVGEIATMLQIPWRSKLTITRSRDVAAVVESLGFGLEPDARYTGFSYGWEQQVGVFKPKDGKIMPPSENCLGAQRLLELCAVIAAADGTVNPEELKVCRNFLEKDLTISPTDRERITILEQVLIEDPSVTKASVARITRQVPLKAREKIAEVLAYIAAVDNVITKDEIRALERIFKAFEFTREKLDSILEAVRPEFKEATVQTAGERVPGEAIPPRGFQIDMARVAAIAQETHEVIGILSKVMAEEEEETVGNTPASPIAAAKEPAPNPATTAIDTKTPPWLTTLEQKYQPIVVKLVERENWSRAEFDTLVKSFSVMPLDAYDAINSWADEHLGDFLLEGDDAIKIHKDLINKGD